MRDDEMGGGTRFMVQTFEGGVNLLGWALMACGQFMLAIIVSVVALALFRIEDLAAMVFFVVLFWPVLKLLNQPPPQNKPAPPVAKTTNRPASRLP